jgi:segregation and condensation protein B
LTELRRRRGKREAEAPELDEAQLVAELRRRAHEWLQPPPPPPPPPPVMPVRVEVLPVTMEGPAPANEAEPPADEAATPPPKKKRAPRRAAVVAADAATVFRRKAWAWFQAHAPAGAAGPPAEGAPAPEPRRRRARREAAPADGVVELRRRAWAWFAPRATGEAAAGTHAPVRPAAQDAAVPEVVRKHLKGVLEALIFASEHPLPAKELARIAKADLKLVRTLLAELVAEYHPRGMRLDEAAGGFVFRTSPVFAPFVREQVARKPVKMSRAQIETLAIVAYRQPVTRPEVDDVRGVDSGAVLKSLLERELVRILGKKDEPGRPMLYGTTSAFLEFFGLKGLSDLPTLREFTELSDESRRTYERELGEEPPEGDTGLMGGEGDLRRPETARAPAVDVAALEDDPTLEKEGGEENTAGEEKAGEPEEAAPPAEESEPEEVADKVDEERAEGGGEEGGDDEGEGEEDEDEDEEDEDEDEDEEDEDDD